LLCQEPRVTTDVDGFRSHQHRRSGRRYATDVTDEELALIGPLLPPAKRGGR
jgi:hypothetical protein